MSRSSVGQSDALIRHRSVVRLHPGQPLLEAGEALRGTRLGASRGRHLAEESSASMFFGELAKWLNAADCEKYYIHDGFNYDMLGI